MPTLILSNNKTSLRQSGSGQERDDDLKADFHSSLHYQSKKLESMKTKLFLMFSVLWLVILSTTMAIGQIPPVDTTGLDAWKPFDGPISLEEMNKTYYVLYSALVIVWGYIAKAFRLKSTKIPFVFVVAAGGLVVGAVLVIYGFDAITVVLSFLVSLGVFDLFIKPGEKALMKPKIA